MLLKQNLKTYKETNQLIQTTIRMQKDATSFFYFTMESNENISFYSTLPFEKGQIFRDIIVTSTPELQETFESILKHCSKTIEITLLEQKTIQDL